MDESPAPPPPPSPTPPVRKSTKGLLIVAMIFSALAAGDTFLPWHITHFFGGDQVLAGTDFTEGKVELGVGSLAAVLFLAALISKSPKWRARLATAAALLAFGAALTPVWLVARGAWAGLKTVVEVGSNPGYTGWGKGLFLATVAGFVAAATGCIGAGRLTPRPSAAPVKLRSLRKPPSS